MKRLAAGLLILFMMVSIQALAGTTEIAYESRGVQVPATLTVPDGLEKYPVVIMAHGHGGSREEGSGFGAIAEALEKQGIASIRMDFPGCGESTEPFTMNTLTHMKADVLAAAAYVRDHLPVTKMGLFGYSMGGRITVELINEGFLPDAVVLLAPAVNYDIYDSMGDEAAEKALSRMESEGHYVFVTSYGQTLDLSREWAQDLEKYAYPQMVDDAAAKYEGPVLVIYAEDDSVINPEDSRYVAEAFGGEELLATGNDHSHGFHSNAVDVRNTVAQGTARFFAFHLK